MVCEPIIIDGKVLGIACRGRRARCSVPSCAREHVALCDWKLTGAKAGKTCSARLCAYHTTKPAPDKDLCPPHAQAWEAWKAQRGDAP